MNSRYSVLIAGGGPVGWACALAARAALGREQRIAVVERQSSNAVPTSGPLSARVYTVAAGNLTWLKHQGVEFDEGRMAAVSGIVVHGRDGRESLHVCADDAGCAELANVVEHEALTSAIAARAQALGVTLITGDCVGLHREGDGVLAELSDRRLLGTQLLIAADGVRSAVREAAGMRAAQHAYPQSGVVANFACATAHRGVARQWFLPDGSILALLPIAALSGDAAHGAVSMVWSLPHARAKALSALEPVALLASVNAVSAPAVRVLQVTSPAQSFPLSVLRLADPVAGRVLAVGDAAHAMHPLAGQGVNVGLADARCLHSVWQCALQVGADAGHPLLTGRYRRERYGPTFAMQFATDALMRLYNRLDHPVLMAAGDAGMRLFGRLPAFRRTLSTAAIHHAL
ncbi:MAG: FAD-dependent monooxygenase [Burkholderiales bacterium]|nr:FAD-dependent monooxygenase [Burkholderiales bacterium]